MKQKKEKDNLYILSFSTYLILFRTFFQLPSLKICFSYSKSRDLIFIFERMSSVSVFTQYLKINNKILKSIQTKTNKQKMTSNYKYEIYAMPVAQPSRAVLWLAALTGFEYELKVTMPNETSKEEYLESINPFGTIPALVIYNKETGEKVDSILDSLAIASYICDVTGERGEVFFPKDPVLRAKVIQMSLFGMTVNRTVTYEIFRPFFISYVTKQPLNLTRKQIDDYLYPKFEGQVVDLFRAQGTLKFGKNGAKDTECDQVTCPFLVPQAGRATFADLANFVETYQLEMLGLADQVYANRPCFKRWTDAVKALPGFDKAHEMAQGFVNANFLPHVPKKEE